jgi:uncharacterized membrane protein
MAAEIMMRSVATAIICLNLLLLPLAYAAEGLDPRKVSVLYTGDPYPGVTPYLSFTEDAFISVDPIRCYHHGGAATALADVHKYMRIYMPRSEQEYLDRYDVVLLSDAYRRAFIPRQLAWFRDSVSEEGFGLAMVAGLDSFGASTSRPAASWSGSVIEEILPVEVPPPAYHHNWISPYVSPGGARINVVEYGNEFMASLPFSSSPRYMSAFDGQIVLEKQGSDVLARWGLPQFSNPPCYATWKPEKGRTFSMLHDWSGSTEFSRWDYYADFSINLVLYLAQRGLPVDYVTVHRYRTNIHSISIGRSMILSLISFVESFGGNPQRIDQELVTLDQMVVEAGDLYLDHDFSSAVAAAEATLDKLKEIEELSVKIKNEALLWVYIVEWLSVTGVGLLSGFLVWSLMVRRRLYREVSATRLSRRLD